MENKSIGDVIFEFVENMEALNESSPIVLSVVASLTSKMSKAFAEYLKKYGEITSQDEDKKIFKFPVERQKRVRSLRQKSNSFKKSINLIPRNFLVSYVSEFDCFLGSLLRVIYTKKPELLNCSSKQITYSELLTFSTLSDAKELILEQEIESILRKSHSEHFSILETKFNMTLRKGLIIWSEFIEITERRNLFVHANGIISSQYLKICKLNGIEVCKLSLGDKLKVDVDYLERAYKVIYEISVKLGHVVWRKLFPEEREIADHNLNDSCVELISKGEYSLAIDFLEFAVSFPKHHSDNIKKMMVINLAQAYKKAGNSNKCIETLKMFDWSASAYNFKLAISALKEEYEQSAKLLRTVVNAGDLSEKAIIEWPIFNEFRKTNEFLVVFKELFNKDYAQQEELMKVEFNSHMDSIFSKNEEKENNKEDVNVIDNKHDGKEE